MNHLSQYMFVCEFRIKLGNHLNQNHIDFLNNIKDVDSSDSGLYTISECDIDGDTLTGRYYLKSDIIHDSESAYLDTMKRDLVLAIKRDLNFQMDGLPEIENTRITQVVTLYSLEPRHNGAEGKKVCYSQSTNMFYVLNDDGYCDGTYYSEEEAINALAN